MSCEAIVRHAGAFRCQSPQGSLDTATGPPDLVLQANEELTVSFSSVLANDTAIVSIWYNENMAGTTVSLAH